MVEEQNGGSESEGRRVHIGGNGIAAASTSSADLVPLRRLVDAIIPRRDIGSASIEPECDESNPCLSTRRNGWLAEMPHSIC
jgi:hypothetical protein